MTVQNARRFAYLYLKDVVKKHNTSLRLVATNSKSSDQQFNDNGIFIQVASEKDVVGPPDPVSNIRPILFHVPPNETDLQKQHRMRCHEVQLWNQEFWRNHNENFIKQREEFVKETKRKRGGESTDALTADEMSQFYKKFLDDNWLVHVKYNKEWYIKNVSLTLSSFKIRLFDICQRLRR